MKIVGKLETYGNIEYMKIHKYDKLQSIAVQSIDNFRGFHDAFWIKLVLLFNSYLLQLSVGHGSSVVKTATKTSVNTKSYEITINSSYVSQLTDDTSGPAAIDERLPEGAVRLAEDPGLGGRVVVVLEEVLLRTVVLQCCANRYYRVVI